MRNESWRLGCLFLYVCPRCLLPERAIQTIFLFFSDLYILLKISFILSNIHFFWKFLTFIWFFYLTNSDFPTIEAWVGLRVNQLVDAYVWVDGTYSTLPLPDTPGAECAKLQFLLIDRNIRNNLLNSDCTTHHHFICQGIRI